MMVSTPEGWIQVDTLDSVSQEEQMRAIYLLNAGDTIELNPGGLAELLSDSY